MTVSEAETEDFVDWIGRTETVSETVAPFPSMALAALFDREPSAAAEGEIGPLDHWLHFLPLHRQSEIADDGHVMRGGFMPPVPLPRRMFAGARIEFVRPIRIGERASRLGRVTEVTSKIGRSGDLIFVSVRQDISGPDGPALTEHQNIVYRSQPGAGAPARQIGGPALERPDWREEFEPTVAALFRYSALLFNAHRIHYDHPYTTGKERYPGLVVHGQLVATLLADLAVRRAGPLASFAFRSHAAFFADRRITLKGRLDGARITLAAEDPDGVVGMTAEAVLRGRT